MKMVILSFAMAALLGAASQQTMTALPASSSPTDEDRRDGLPARADLS